MLIANADDTRDVDVVFCVCRRDESYLSRNVLVLELSLLVCELKDV